MNKKIAVIGSVVALSVLVPTAAVIVANNRSHSQEPDEPSRIISMTSEKEHPNDIYENILAGKYDKDIALMYDSIPSNVQSNTIIGMCVYDETEGESKGVKAVNFIPPTQSEVKACQYTDSSWEKANGHKGRNMTTWYPLYADGHISKIGLFGVYREGQLGHFPPSDKIGDYEMKFREDDRRNVHVEVYKCSEPNADWKFSQNLINSMKGIQFQTDIIGSTNDSGFIPKEYLRADENELYISRKGLGTVLHSIGGKHDIEYGFNAKAPYRAPGL